MFPTQHSVRAAVLEFLVCFTAIWEAETTSFAGVHHDLGSRAQLPQVDHTHNLSQSHCTIHLTFDAREPCQLPLFRMLTCIPISTATVCCRMLLCISEVC